VSGRMKNTGFIGRALMMSALSLAFLVPSVWAQTPGSPRVTISALFGYIGGGPASGIEALLLSGGFGDLLVGGCRLGFCDGDTQYPSTAGDPGPGSNVRVAYSQWSHFEVALSMGAASPSPSSGYSQVLVPDFGRFSEVKTQVRMFAPTAGIRWNFVGVGAGPAYYRLNTAAGDEFSQNPVFGSDGAVDESTVTKVGALLEADGQFVMFKKLILELRVQYRLIGSTDVGPLRLASRELPVTSVDFSHMYFGVGLGLSFR
jgi:hypothetical protein